MRNASLLSADRRTHIRIVLVALSLASVVVASGLAARVSDASGQSAPMLTAGKPLTTAARDTAIIR